MAREINIIGNNCVGTALIEQYYGRYSNPFAWCVIKGNDWFTLIEDWDRIDFKNVETFRAGDTQYGLRNIENNRMLEDSVTLRLDGKISVHFMHHIVNENDKTIRRLKDKITISYCDMLNYVKDKWLKRVDRMTSPPIFVFRMMNNWFSDEQVQRFIDMDTRFHRYLIAVDDSKYNNKEKLKNYCSIPTKMPVFEIAKICQDNSFLKQDSIMQARIEAKAQKTFIKIVIPCWGVKDTIGRMLDSILNQTFHDYHVVCVDDCSTDGTLQVLKAYKRIFPEQITLIENEHNVGAGMSRNIGVFQTEDSVIAEYLWIVDGDDYLADEHTLQKIYEYCRNNRDKDIVNIGWTNGHVYMVARLGWPIGFPGRVIKPHVYVPGIEKNIPCCNDVYSHFIMFDRTDDDKIGYLDYNCYIYPKPGRHINSKANAANALQNVGIELMKHEFRKESVVDELMNGMPHQTGKHIKQRFPEFKLKLKK